MEPTTMNRVLRFTGEEARCEQVATVLKDQLACAVEVFRKWSRLDMNPHILRWVSEGKIEPIAIRVAMPLYLQATRLYRSVIEEAARCEAISGVSLSRTMFETALALCFVTKNHVGIEPKKITVKVKGKEKEKWIAEASSNNLSRDLRARLYVHSSVLAERRHTALLLSKPATAQIGKALEAIQDGEIENVSTDAETNAVWNEILEETGKYSGLSIERLSECLDPQLNFWYNTVYRMQCFTVHANDAIRQVRSTPEGGQTGSIYSTFGEVRFALYTATGVFLTCVAALNNDFGFGPDIERELDELGRRFNEIFSRAAPARESHG